MDHLVTRELGLGLQTDLPLAAYGELGRTVEDAGFAVVTLFNDLWFRPPLGGLLEVARATGRVASGRRATTPTASTPSSSPGRWRCSTRPAAGGRSWA